MAFTFQKQIPGQPTVEDVNTAMSYPPIIQDINNAILKGPWAMPIKDSTSDGSSRFRLGRLDFVRGYSPMNQEDFTGTKNLPNPNSSIFSVINNQVVNTGRPIRFSGATYYQKKWIGGTRDASQVIDRRRNAGIATGSLNQEGGPLAFTTKNNVNTIREAKKYCRSGGSSVPAKCIHKYPDPPIFY